MDPDELAILDKSVRHALTSEAGADSAHRAPTAAAQLRHRPTIGKCVKLAR